MLEKMADFFARRLDGYDDHMLTEIEGAREFYPFTASLLPTAPKARVLDLGCGTGLELECFFALNPTARVTGIDLSEDMLAAAAAKFEKNGFTPVRGSYFDVPFGDEAFDAAVSVESLHHFSPELKAALYRKLHDALKKGGRFVLTDYFAPSDDVEKRCAADFERLKAEQGVSDGGFYHYDVPLTVAHETALLKRAGFDRVTVEKSWGATSVLTAARARKRRGTSRSKERR